MRTMLSPLIKYTPISSKMQSSSDIILSLQCCKIILVDWSKLYKFPEKFYFQVYKFEHFYLPKIQENSFIINIWYRIDLMLVINTILLLNLIELIF